MRVPKKKPSPAYIQLSPALQSEVRKLQHAAARGSSASAAEWARVSRAADKALALLLPDKGPRSMEISTIYNCQDIGFECEPEKKQSEQHNGYMLRQWVFGWIHHVKTKLRVLNIVDTASECTLRFRISSWGDGQVENIDRHLRQMGEFQTMSDELTDVKEQLCVTSPTDEDDPDERFKHCVSRQQYLIQQQPPTESPPQKNNMCHHSPHRNH